MSSQLKPLTKPQQTLSDDALSHLVGYALVKANLVFGKTFQQAIGRPMSLTPVEFTLLTLLANNQKATQKDIAAQLKVRAPNLTVILNRLSQRGLVTSERNDSDGRSVLIGLSAAGKKLQATAYEISLTMEKPVLSGLNRSDRSTLLELLERVTNQDHTKT